MLVSWKNSIIMLANYHAFQPGAVTAFPCVQSRYFVWCRSGKGTITLNGTRFDMTVGSYLFAPWNHAIRYESDQEEPLVIGSIHVIPNRMRGGVYAREIFHAAASEQPEYRQRHDEPLKGFESIRSGWAAESSTLLSYADFTVRAFREKADEDQLREMAPVLIREIDRAGRRKIAVNQGVPIVLQEMLNFIESHLEMDISMDQLEVKSGYSPPTVYRLFRKYLHRTPGEWIYHRKMFHAAQLLLSSNLSIGEIAHRVAIDDPYYFSRLFKRHIGMTARAFRKDNAIDAR